MYQDQSRLIYFNRLLFAKQAKSKEDNTNKAQFEYEPKYIFMHVHIFKGILTIFMKPKEGLNAVFEWKCFQKEHLQRITTQT